MFIGYARVSTKDQDPSLQIDALKAAGCERIYTDHASGTKEHRPEYDQVCEMLREGDTLVVWKLDRLGRSLKHLVKVINDFQEAGVGFRSLTESIDTTTPGGKLIFHIFGALAEFERDLIVERTNAGLKAARARGRKGGRPPSLVGKEKQKAVKLYHAGIYNVKQICDLMNISIPTLYKYVNEAAEKRKEASDK